MSSLKVWIAVGCMPLILSACDSRNAKIQDIDRLPSGLLIEPAPLPGAEPTAPLRPVVAKGIALTKSSEGWVDQRYNDAVGYCTIGYGHLIKKARCDGTEPAQFLQKISDAQGTTLLVDDMRWAQITVTSVVTVPLTDLQYAALADFVFNVGANNFKTSTLLRVINEQHFAQVPYQLGRWKMAGGKVLPGLEQRRQGEIDLFFEGQTVPKEMLHSGTDDAIDIRTGEQ
jgi:GH24 family phage-related lysozyme (muramidase)